MGSVGRTSAIMDALKQQLEQRRSSIDAAEDLGEITVTVKMQAGTNWVRGVVWQEELVRRSTRGAS